MAAFARGQRLGPYEILGPLGAGGMGEVYRATDTNLNRDVAIKILPGAFADDPDRMARFTREARVLASLNHPNIAGIYGLERQNNIPFLILELVPGSTLAELLVAGPLQIPEALHVGRQIAEALESAHEKGIIHRDLKPANVKVTPEGKVKVLDFGLAKAFRGEGSEAENSPTVSLSETRDGTILGTAAYMSPEQARGKPLDKRTDIWSFGCVFYEALTGRRAFAGNTLSDTLASVLQHEPDLDSLPAAIPANVRVLLRRCLNKEREQRLRDVGDARIEIDEALGQWGKAEPNVLVARQPRRLRTLLCGAVGCVLLGTTVGWLFPRIGPDQRPQLLAVERLTHEPEFSESPTWSPDGKQLAFASNRSGNYEIYVRRVEGGKEVNVSNDPGQDFQPAFSPDGNWIAFVSTRSSRTGMVKTGSINNTEFRTYGGDVWVAPALGGQAKLLGKDGNFPSWQPSGRKVVYVGRRENHRSILETGLEGGAPRTLLPSEESSWEIVRAQYSPAGRWISFETWDREIYVFPAGGGTPRKILNGINHVWDPSGTRLYYCTRNPLGGTRLHWVEMDENKGETKGEPQTLTLMTGILRDLSISRDGQQFAVAQWEAAQNLARLPLTAEGSSPAGPEEVLSRGQIIDRMPQVSPDGRSIAYTSDRLGLDELWIARLDPTRLDRLQFPDPDQGVSGPHWFPDGRRLAVIRIRPDAKLSLWSIAADGSQAEELTSPESMLNSEGFPVSPDGNHIVYAAKAGRNYQLYSFDIRTRRAQQITFSADDKSAVCWSPDGRWMVYVSDASGDLQLWKMPATGGEAQRLTTGTDRIRHMFYSSDGRWLYFQPNHLNIYRMPPDGGPVQQVTHFLEAGLFIEEPTISPDNRYLSYTRSSGGSSLWRLKIGVANGKSN